MRRSMDALHEATQVVQIDGQPIYEASCSCGFAVRGGRPLVTRRLSEHEAYVLQLVADVPEVGN